MSKWEEDFEEWWKLEPQYVGDPVIRREAYHYKAKRAYLAACAKRGENVGEAIELIREARAFLIEPAILDTARGKLCKALAILEGGKGETK